MLKHNVKSQSLFIPIKKSVVFSEYILSCRKKELLQSIVQYSLILLLFKILSLSIKNVASKYQLLGGLFYNEEGCLNYIQI